MSSVYNSFSIRNMLVLNYFLTFFILATPTLYFVYLLLEIKKDLKKTFFYVLILFLLSAVLLNKLLLFPVTLAQKDFNNIQIPMFQFFHDSISRYFLPPVWNSTFSGGFDAFSSPLSPYFSIFNWVFLIGSNVYKSFSFFILLQVFLCALFSFYMLKTFKLSNVSSFLGAVLFTFNGFVIMRLSQGVGIEYLYAYKWLPLILAFSKKLLDSHNLKHFFCLAISISLSFEGSINQVVASGVMLLFYLISEYKKLSGALKYFIFLVPAVFILYAVKLVPFIELVTSGVSRFSSRTGGWRQGNIDWDMFPEILFPIKFNFSNAVFTPGLLGILIFAGGLMAASVFLMKQKRAPFEGFAFVSASVVLSVILTVENPLYFLFYSLPVLNQTTQIPSFLIFYVIPIVFFGAFSLEKLNIYLRRTKAPKLLIALILHAIPLAVFLEVLIGPSTFGNDTYSFNFSKMNISESVAFPHYNLMSSQPAGLLVFYGKGEENIFFYPYGISRTNLKTLNGYHYFFGSLSGQDLLDSGLDEIKKRADYIMTIEPLTDSDLTYVGKVSMSKIKNFDSHAVFENQQDYLRLYSTGWNDDVFIYKTNCLRECSVKNLSDNPIEFEVTVDTSIGSEIIPTSIAFSPWLKARYGGNYVPLYKDSLGYVAMDLRNVPNPQAVVSFTYTNPYIYVGFILSLAGFICTSVFVFKKSCK